jgi:hydroxyethylthiazole kinase
VGAGATKLRTEAAKRILAETKVTLVRGNASEILALGGGAAKTKGVDAADSVEAAAERAGALARELGVPVAITGAVDYVTDGKRVVRVANGHPLMGCVTGTGCGATAIIGAFAGVDADPVSAAATPWPTTGWPGNTRPTARRDRDRSRSGSWTPHGLTAEEILHGCKILGS